MYVVVVLCKSLGEEPIVFSLATQFEVPRKFIML